MTKSGVRHCDTARAGHIYLLLCATPPGSYKVFTGVHSIDEGRRSRHYVDLINGIIWLAIIDDLHLNFTIFDRRRRRICRVCRDGGDNMRASR